MKYIKLKVKKDIDRFLVLADAGEEKICFLMDQNNGTAITDPTKHDEILDEKYYLLKKQISNAEEYSLSKKHTELVKVIVKKFLEDKKPKKQVEIKSLFEKLQMNYENS